MYPKLETITETPAPAPEAVAAAKKTGATIVPFDPRRMRAFLQGRITLAELEGIPKENQYEIAQIGYGFLNDGQLHLAETIFKGLLALDPHDAYFHTVRGSIAHRQGDRETAARHYDRALEINPYSGSALANRGELRLSLGEVEGALDDLVRCLDLDKDGKEPCTQRARVILDAIVKQAKAYPAKPKAATAVGRPPSGSKRPRASSPSPQRRVGTPVKRPGVPRRRG